MFKKILVPLDLTDKHRPALGKAADLARHCCSTVTLLHVIEVIPGLAVEEDKDFYQRIAQKARTHLEASQGFVSRWAVNAQQEIRYGHAAWEIVHYAADTGHDLIILTAPCFDPNQPAVSWGSLSYKVGVLASCPVLLVK